MEKAVLAEVNARASADAAGAKLSLRQALFRDQHIYGLIVTDRDSTIIDWSPAAERIYGYSRDEVLGQPTSLLRLPDDIPAVADSIRAGVERDGYWSGQIGIVRKDGTEGVTDTVVFSFIDDQGQPATIGINRDITETIQIQAALRESAERLQSITDSVAALILYYDADQRCRFVNETAIRVMGRPRAHIIGKRISDLVGDDAFQTFLPYLKRAFCGEEVTFEHERAAPDGSRKIFQATYLPNVGENGRVLGCYVVSVDITENKRAETEAQENEARLRMITDNVAATIIYIDADQRYQFVNKNTEDVYGRPRSEIIGRTMLEVQGEAGYRRLQPHVQTALGGEEVTFEQDWATPDGTHRHYQTTYLPDVDQNGTVNGINVVLFDITERKQSEIVLQDNELRLRLITDNMPANVIYFDPEQRVQFVNKGVEEFYGLPRDELIGKLARDIQGDTMYANIGPQIERALNGEEVVFEQARVASDGSSRHYQSLYLPHLDDCGRVLGCYALSVDITARTRAEAGLKENEHRLRLITDNVGANITYIDRDWRYQFVNKNFADVLGMSIDEIIGKSAREIQGDEMLRRVAPYIERALGGEQASFERSRIGADGVNRSYQSTYLPHFDGNGEVLGIYGLSVDISERANSEREARENAERLRLITDNVGANITYLDRDQRYRYINGTFADVLGMTSEEVIGKTAREIQGEENYRLAGRHIEAALRGEEVTFERIWEGRNGDSRSFQATYLPHYDGHGAVIGTYGLSVDITELKRAESVARENEARLRLVTDNIGAMIVYFDADQRYQFVNKAFEGLHGLSADDLVGRRLIDVLGNDAYREIKTYIEAGLDGQQVTFEQVRTLPNGLKRTYHSTYLPHFDGGGEVLGCYALLVDVTERVNADRELRENEQRLRLITDNMPGHFIYFDADLNYRHVNKGVEELFGMPREEIIGKNSRDI